MRRTPKLCDISPLSILLCIDPAKRVVEKNDMFYNMVVRAELEKFST